MEKHAIATVYDITKHNLLIDCNGEHVTVREILYKCWLKSYIFSSFVATNTVVVWGSP